MTHNSGYTSTKPDFLAANLIDFNWVSLTCSQMNEGWHTIETKTFNWGFLLTLFVRNGSDSHSIYIYITIIIASGHSIRKMLKVADLSTIPSTEKSADKDAKFQLGFRAKRATLDVTLQSLFLSQGSLNATHFRVDQTMQMSGNFVGIPFLYCVVWVGNIVTFANPWCCYDGNIW